VPNRNSTRGISLEKSNMLSQDEDSCITLSLGRVELCLTPSSTNDDVNDGDVANRMMSISRICNGEVVIDLNNFVGTLRVKNCNRGDQSAAKPKANPPSSLLVPTGAAHEDQGAVDGGTADRSNDFVHFDDKNDNAFIDGTSINHPTKRGNRMLATGEEKHPSLSRALPLLQVGMDGKGTRLLVMNHHGKIAPLPPNWKFTSMTCQQLIHNWFIGDSRNNIPPLCALDSSMIRHLNLNKSRLSMKGFMRIVEEFARERDCWIEKESDWDYWSLNKMWETIKPDFTANFCVTNRKKEMSWKTAYNNMSKMNAFKHYRNRQQLEGDHEI